MSESSDEMPESSSRYNLRLDAQLGFDWAQRAHEEQRGRSAPEPAQQGSSSDPAHQPQEDPEVIDSDDNGPEQHDPEDMDIEEPTATTFKQIVDNLEVMLLVMQSWITTDIDTTSKYMSAIIDGKFQLEMKATVLMTKADSMRSPENCTAPKEALDEYTEIAGEYNELKGIFQQLREAKE